MMQRLASTLHEAWLLMLMAGVMTRTGHKQTLLEFSDILFRHFGWIERELISAQCCYDYDREGISIRANALRPLLDRIQQKLTNVSEMLEGVDMKLAARIRSDLTYFVARLGAIPDETIRAFDAGRALDDICLDAEATDALTLFLFEESYKEYELILIYHYLQLHSQDAFLNQTYQTLVDESFFHFRQFLEMMAQMGILAVPRMVSKELYQIEDIGLFLRSGIDEELAAKQECRRLSEAVGTRSPELAQFFDCINYQEDYHITLMETALDYYEGLTRV
jgi:hypothetical protein